MYAIVKIGGHQYKVSQGDNLTVNRIEGNEGDTIQIGEVLMVSDGSTTEIGTPSLNKKISAKILSHEKGDKVIVFRKKRRKGYEKKNGHRQALTKISIEAIA
jgi:large subunit ribosomal protein L21